MKPHWPNKSPCFPTKKVAIIVKLILFFFLNVSVSSSFFGSVGKTSATTSIWNWTSLLGTTMKLVCDRRPEFFKRIFLKLITLLLDFHHALYTKTSQIAIGLPKVQIETWVLLWDFSYNKPMVIGSLKPTSLTSDFITRFLSTPVLEWLPVARTASEQVTSTFSSQSEII